MLQIPNFFLDAGWYVLRFKLHSLSHSAQTIFECRGAFDATVSKVRNTRSSISVARYAPKYLNGSRVWLQKRECYPSVKVPTFGWAWPCDHVSSRRKGYRNDRQTITLHISGCLQRGALVIMRDIRYLCLFRSPIDVLYNVALSLSVFDALMKSVDFVAR